MWFQPRPLKVSLSFDSPLYLTFDPPPAPSQAEVRVSTTIDGITVQGAAPMAYTLPNDKEVALNIAYVDAKGNPAAVDGDVTWQSSDDNICTVTAKPGHQAMNAMVIPAANLGNAQISATADADMGEGIKEIITLFDLTVVSGSAVAGTITPTEAMPVAAKQKK
jgi:hypothetical protein